VSFLAQEEICSAEEVLDATSKRDELIAEIAPPQSYSVFKYCATVFERSANYRLIALRDRVVTVVDPAIREDQVRITIALKDGRRLEKFIEHAIGSVEKPMSDAALEAKFTDLAAGILPPDQIRRLMDLCWNIDDLHAAAEVAKAATA
jgi:2-methylcitrate dehydratase PrpD